MHIFRLVELVHLWQNGVFFSRWLPDLAYGYGLPLFNYYAPLVYYLTAPLYFLGFPISLTLNVSLGMALVVLTFGVFVLARNLFSEAVPSTLEGMDGKMSRIRDETAAFVAALACLYSPYILFNALDRANLAEQWALALIPWTLWAFWRTSRTPSLANWVIAVISFAALLLAHNVTGLLFTPVLFSWILVMVLFFRGAANVSDSSITKRLLNSFSAFFMAVAFTTFFWLPALVERNFVQIARVVVTPDFDYRFNFVPFAELVALLPRANTGQLNPTFPATLGLVQVVLVVLGIGAITIIARRMHTARGVAPLIYLLGAGFVFVFLMLPISQWIWDHMELLAYVQLPMRMRGIIAVLLAPIAGAAVFLFPARWREAGAALASLMLLVTALPLLYPSYERDFPPNPSLLDMFAYETSSGAIGTTSFGEYLPVWVQNPPEVSPFADAYAGGKQPNRFVLPEGVTSCGDAINFDAQSLCANSPVSWRAVFRALYFPGWRARINNVPAAIQPTAREGMISFDVPAGEQKILVQYEETPIERFADSISLAAVLIVLVVGAIGLWQWNRSKFVGKWQLETGDNLSMGNLGHRGNAIPPLALFFVAVALIAFKFVFADHFDSPLVTHFDGENVQGVEEARQVKFGDELELLGYDLSSGKANPGDTLTATLYWRAQIPLKRNLSSYVHLTTRDGSVLAQKDNLHPANLPTTRWDSDAFVADSHTFQVPEDLPPGGYELRAGAYDPEDNVRLLTPDGADYVLLGRVSVGN